MANHYLKWALVEAANCIVMRKQCYAGSHVVALYERLRASKNHGKAAVAVARHLAEASWWMLTKKTSLSRAGAGFDAFVQYRVSAESILADLSCLCDCETRDEAMLMLLEGG